MEADALSANIRTKCRKMLDGTEPSPLISPLSDLCGLIQEVLLQKGDPALIVEQVDIDNM
jgi:hypothetical protein